MNRMCEVSDEWPIVFGRIRAIAQIYKIKYVAADADGLCYNIWLRQSVNRRREITEIE